MNNQFIQLLNILQYNIYFYNFLPKPKNWVGLTVVNFRAVKNNMQNNIAIRKLFKTGISSSVTTLRPKSGGYKFRGS